MKKGVAPNSELFVSKNAHLIGASPFDRLGHGQTLETDKLSKFLADIQNKINEGFAKDASDRCFELLENYNNSIEAQSQINRLLSIALENQGLFAEAFNALQPFENEQIIVNLTEETRASVLAQLAIGYSYSDDSQKAILLLNVALKIAEDRDLLYLLIIINLNFARIYQDLSEYSAARNYTETALKFARDFGDRRGLAEANLVHAKNYFREGNAPKSIEILQQTIKIIGDRPAQYLLAKIYSDLCAFYSADFRPQDGFEIGQKAVKIFENIELPFESVIANYHLGNSYLLSGDWAKSEQTLTRALDSALEINHPQIPLILASLGEIEFLRGDNDEAEKIFTHATDFTSEFTKDRYRIPALYNLARCLLTQNKFDAAITQAKTAVEYSQKTKEHNFLNLSKLVLAEAFLKKRKTSRAEEILREIEEKEDSANYLVLGNIARIRALMALSAQDNDLMLHHFNRSLSIFEMAKDYYSSGLVNYEIGKNIIQIQPDKALKHLESASQIFRRLNATQKVELTNELLGKINKKAVSQIRESSTASQLLMLRLVEATASRELLVRELVTILRQDGKAKKILFAELKDGRRFQPTVIDGFSPTENVELMVKLQEAQSQNDLDTFASQKNLSISQLHSPNSIPALLIISPANGANLKDGSSILPLLQVVELGMEVCGLREINKDKVSSQSFNPFSSDSLMPGFIHSSPAMMEIVNEIRQIADSDVNVLITGESGTGKELIARAVYHVSTRNKKTFVPFNCTAVPKDLTEGHLFGYKKGAFTGAVQDSEGVIRTADKGTLFLDEIGDLGLDVQPKLLRFLQEGEVQPLGATTPQNVNVRIIAATNMQIEEMVMRGLFREDLYYRLNVIRLKIPPLRERRSEIPQLVDYYIKYYSARFGRKDLSISSEALDLLIAFHWKGNVRQLCNEIQRMVARANSGDKITPQHLSADIKPNDDFTSSSSPNNVRAIGLNDGAINIQTEGASLEEAVAALETQMIADSLKRHSHNISKVAKELNITRRGIYLKLERYNLK